MVKKEYLFLSHVSLCALHFLHITHFAFVLTFNTATRLATCYTRSLELGP